MYTYDIKLQFQCSIPFLDIFWCRFLNAPTWAHLSYFYVECAISYAEYTCAQPLHNMHIYVANLCQGQQEKRKYVQKFAADRKLKTFFYNQEKSKVVRAWQYSETHRSKNWQPHYWAHGLETVRDWHRPIIWPIWLPHGIAYLVPMSKDHAFAQLQVQTIPQNLQWRKLLQWFQRCGLQCLDQPSAQLRNHSLAQRRMTIPLQQGGLRGNNSFSILIIMLKLTHLPRDKMAIIS